MSDTSAENIARAVQRAECALQFVDPNVASVSYIALVGTPTYYKDATEQWRGQDAALLHKALREWLREHTRRGKRVGMLVLAEPADDRFRWRAGLAIIGREYAMAARHGIEGPCYVLEPETRAILEHKDYMLFIDQMAKKIEHHNAIISRVGRAGIL